jgi:hypothetical protein
VERPFSATCAGHGTDHGVVETESFDVAVQYGTYLGPLREAFKLPCEYPTLCHFRWGRYAECLGQGNSLTVQYLTEHLVTTALHTTCELGRANAIGFNTEHRRPCLCRLLSTLLSPSITESLVIWDDYMPKQSSWRQCHVKRYRASSLTKFQSATKMFQYSSRCSNSYTFQVRYKY